MQEDDLKIDVGDADEQATEIDLDAAPQEEQAEEKPEIEIAEAPGTTHEEKEEVKTEQKEELSEYSESVKKRIAKLTHKMREAERQKEEAIEYAKRQTADAEKYRRRYESLDGDYTKEFEKRVTSGTEAIKTKLAAAIASGDVNAQVAAQAELAQLSMDATRLARLKEVNEKVVAQAPETTPEQASPPQPQRQPDPKADAWAQKNPWFGTDNAMTYTAFDIHKQLVEQEGYDGQSDEYYAEVDKRIRLEFPHKFDTNKGTTAEPVQTVASANRPAAKGRRKTVKLTPSQVAISKRLGVPLEEYAKQLAAKEV
jgi:predicted phage tail protein